MQRRGYHGVVSDNLHGAWENTIHIGAFGLHGTYRYLIGMVGLTP
jgi:hypothetical protein